MIPGQWLWTTSIQERYIEVAEDNQQNIQFPQ